MAQSGFTPISIYYSSTAGNTPTAGNLVAGELAINTADGRLFYKDSAGVVQVIGTKGGVGSSSTTQVLYNSSGLVVGSANMTFSGTALTLANDASISGLTVGKGGGSLSTNTALGNIALTSNTSGVRNVAVGYYSMIYNTTGGQNTSVGVTALYNNTTGNSNLALGDSALYNNTTGGSNTGAGIGALQNNTTASNNTAVGYQAAYTSTTGAGVTAVGYKALYTGNANNNSAFGSYSLYSNTTGVANSAFGGELTGTAGATLGSNTTGSYNSAFGIGALQANTTASYNTAVGYQAAYSNTTGIALTAIGDRALYNCAGGQYNAAVGGLAMYANTTGNNNVALGSGGGSTYGALQQNTTGSYNTAIGSESLKSNTTGTKNTAVGYQAGYNSNDASYGSVFIGYQAGLGITSGGGSTFVGAGAGSLCTTPNFNTILGCYNGNQNSLDLRTTGYAIVLSNGQGTPGAYWLGSGGWYQNNNSTLWAITSDARIKKNITPLENGLSTILALQPKEFDYIVTNQHDVGFIAQDYETVLPSQITEQNSSGEYAELTGGDKLKGIQQNLVPYLVKAIQELKAEIDQLKGVK